MKKSELAEIVNGLSEQLIAKGVMEDDTQPEGASAPVAKQDTAPADAVSFNWEQCCCWAKVFAGRCDTLVTMPTIVYDSATISTYSEQQIDARYNGRKTGSDDDLKKIKFLVLYEARTCQPIAFRKLPGNISDVVTIRNAIEQLKVLGITDAELVTDGGYYSMENVSRLFKAGSSFITRARTSIAWVAEAIDKNMDYMDDPAAAVPFDPAIHAVRVTKMQEFKHTRIYRSAKKELNAVDTVTFRRRIYIYIYRNELRQAEQSRAPDEKIRALRDVLEGGTPLDDPPS